MFTEKMQDYCKHRASGVAQRDAAIAAGYSLTAASVTASRLEVRTDVQNEIARIKKELKKGKAAGPPVVGGDSLPDPAQSPLAPWALKDTYASPLALMLDVSNNPKAPIGIRIQCAKDALPYCHAKKGESGQKDAAQEAAEKVAGSSGKSKTKFPTQPVPIRRVK